MDIKQIVDSDHEQVECDFRADFPKSESAVIKE